LVLGVGGSMAGGAIGSAALIPLCLIVFGVATQAWAQSAAASPLQQ